MTGIQAAVLIAGMACISGMAIVGCATGHDGPLLTAAVSAVTGLCGGGVGYVRGVKAGVRRTLDGK